ncbi:MULTISPECIES: ZIP family metal transporter [unclassified Iodidimonas]|jgi:zinc transporter ZupT|uniref:ZIP family metal transporter n=1 Tax=unclassified Iodidimonas TaxID=2626145 RepID=UPI002482E328|nr:MULTISPECIES: ZIP family metal transporter [unclassified Iodidimonas]
MAPFPSALLFSLIAAFGSLCGLLVIRHYENWGQRNSVLFAAFAAGILLSSAFLHIIPHAMFAAPRLAPIALMLGYLALYAIGLATSRKDHASHMDKRAIALIPVIGIAIHSFVDGLAYSVSFSIDQHTGMMAVMGLILHEFPESIMAFVLLLRGGFHRQRAFFLAFLASTLTTPMGMLVSFPFVSMLNGPLLGALLAATAGALIFVAASHLVPNIEHDRRQKTGIFFFAGILFTAILQLTHLI